MKRKGSLWTAFRLEIQHQLFFGSPACQLTLKTLILPFSTVQFLKINLNRWCSDRQTDGKTDWSILLVCVWERERSWTAVWTVWTQCELCRSIYTWSFFHKSRLHYYTICSWLSVEPWIQRAKCKVIHGFSAVQGSVLLTFLPSCCSSVNCRDRWIDR